jgi:hypothetical protein
MLQASKIHGLPPEKLGFLGYQEEENRGGAREKAALALRESSQMGQKCPVIPKPAFMKGRALTGSARSRRLQSFAKGQTKASSKK